MLVPVNQIAGLNTRDGEGSWNRRVVGNPGTRQIFELFDEPSAGAWRKLRFVKVPCRETLMRL